MGCVLHANVIQAIFSLIFILLIEYNSEEDVNQIQSLCNRVLPIVGHLRENSHLQLAFAFSVHMLDTLAQYMQQQDMGLPIFSEVNIPSVEYLEENFIHPQGSHQPAKVRKF